MQHSPGSMYSSTALLGVVAKQAMDSRPCGAAQDRLVYKKTGFDLHTPLHHELDCITTCLPYCSQSRIVCLSEVVHMSQAQLCLT